MIDIRSERVKSRDRLATAAATAAATGVNLRSAPWEFVADLISRGQILDFEFHLSRRLPRFMPRRSSSQLTLDPCIYSRALWLYPPAAYISPHGELREIMNFSRPRPYPATAAPARPFSRRKLYILLREYRRYISRDSARGCRKFSRANGK